jgi:anhydro-N-acetylmuramic acid kinase
MGHYYIGLISGTSMDGIDAALVSFGDASVEIHTTRAHPYPSELRKRLLAAIRNPDQCTIDEIGQLDRWTGECFRDAAQTLIADAQVAADQVTAIGSHGQTLRHRPDANHPFTIQVGDPTVIAKGTGITTVADFRRADLALGGQGAPLTPLYHEWLCRQAGSNKVILNIGGIANITILPADDRESSGFDTGPGNTLLDAWINKNREEPFDRSGGWAAEGAVDDNLLSRLLADPYFQAAPPKSTGFEYFNLEWLEAAGIAGIAPVDVQATLCALTARSVSAAIQAFAPDSSDVLVCGGGVHNAELMMQLDTALADSQVNSTAAVGLDPDWVEAAAFAWLAMRTMDGLTGNLPGVTGAQRATVLGAIFPAD